MIQAIQPYIDLILRERSWSWAVVCLLYILAAMSVRGWFVGPLSAQMKMLEKKHGQKLKKTYLKASFLGWMFFFLPLILIILYWRREALPLPVKENFFLIAGVVSFVISIILHLQAFGVAALVTLESVETEKSGV